MDPSQNAGNKPKGSSKWVPPRITRSTPVYTEDEDLAPAPAAQPSGPVQSPSPSQQASDDYTGSSNQDPATELAAALAEAFGPSYPSDPFQQASNNYTGSFNPILGIDYTAAVAEAFGPSYPQNPFQQASNNYTSSFNPILGIDYTAAVAEAFGPSYPQNPFQQASNNQTGSSNQVPAPGYTQAPAAQHPSPSYPKTPIEQALAGHTGSSNQVPAPGFAAAPGPCYSPKPSEQADESIRDLHAGDPRTTYFIRGLQRQIADISKQLRQHLARCPRGNVDELARERKVILQRMRRAHMKLDRPTPESALPRAKRAKLVSSNMDDSTLVTTFENRIKLEQTIRKIHEMVGDLKSTLDQSVNEP
ncbi:hypothetical protein FPOAC2_10002 [Fusarium poae]|uniref:hypothetical protein n=1 Tax=Fusarium poae TaxID=36050 RepID=UPI001CE88F1D|nr:hypothetical protein FPOAC1_010058 [Fusarium poae]KAG8670627.1 hypothetical protein FPOAC1_010058 [Fusarium poae]